MSGNGLEEKATGCADEFDMEGRRRWQECSFLANNLLGTQDQLHSLQEPMQNENIGPCVQNILGILRQGEKRWGTC